MKYYIVADTHGFYTELKEALESAGFFEDKEKRKLVICGDLFDRGLEARKLLDFVLELIKKDEIVLIRGNHEDLLFSLMNNWNKGSYFYSQHESNGTVDTVLQLTGCNKADLFSNPEFVYKRLKESALLTKIIPFMVNYFETENYVFVHGWIPCNSFKVNAYVNRYEPLDDWRSATNEEWALSRWVNGMEAAQDGILVKGKTVVCGHWHCSFGHSLYEHKGPEFGDGAIYTPYKANGIIAIDACTPVSHKINCILINDSMLEKEI